MSQKTPKTNQKPKMKQTREQATKIAKLSTINNDDDLHMETNGKKAKQAWPLLRL